MTFARRKISAAAAVLAALAVLASSCVPGADEETGDAIRTRLDAKVAALRPEDPYGVASDAKVGSARSGAVPGLTYHWLRARGRMIHDFRVVHVARVGDRMIDPEDLAGWAPLFAEWQPRNAAEAVRFCAEAIAAGITESAYRLRYPALLTLDDEVASGSPFYSRRLTRARNTTEVTPPTPGSPAWEVRVWIKDFPLRHDTREATRYRCRIPAGPRPLEVGVVDSIDRRYDDDPRVRARLEAALRRSGDRERELFAHIESAPSYAVEGLTYHWTGAGRVGMHTTSVALAEHRGRWFDPTDPRAWRPLLAEWQPRSEAQAVSLCSEVVAIRAGRAWSIGRSRDTVLAGGERDLDPVVRPGVSPAIATLPHREPGPWAVLQWTFDPSEDPRLPVAARYRCEIHRGSPGLVLQVVDSLWRWGKPPAPPRS